jgi:hypothetical protein
MTDADGHFRHDGLKRGKLTIGVQADGFAPLMMPVEAGPTP